MNAVPNPGSLPSALNPQQIESLQSQIRQFKNLQKQFAESKIPKLIEALQISQAEALRAAAVAASAAKEVHKEVVIAPVPAPTQPAAPSLSWQCFNSLLFCGPSRFPQDGAISFASSDFGCFMKSAHLPLVVTMPYAVSLRESVLRVAAKKAMEPPVALKAIGAASSATAADAATTKAGAEKAAENGTAEAVVGAMDVVPAQEAGKTEDVVSAMADSSAETPAGASMDGNGSAEGNGNRGEPSSSSITVVVANGKPSVTNSSDSKTTSTGAPVAEVAPVAPPVSLLPPPLWAVQRRMRAQALQHVVTVSTEARAAAAGLSSAAAVIAQEDAKWYPSSQRPTQMVFPVPSFHPAVALGPSNYLAELLPYRNFYRTKKQMRKDVKAWEREERRRRLEVEDRRKRRSTEYHKTLMAHKDEFFRFHKNKKMECGKAARAVKAHVEAADVRKEKDGARAEIRRLQALKENDMEAYTNLVQETKNGRLKFLLNETDSYISTINRMIQEQREEANEGEEAAVEEASSPRSKIEPTSKNYYNETHSKVETVVQPTMMRGGDLKEYQLAGLQWLISLYNNNLNGILADEMGLGKTIQTISMVCYLMEYKNNMGPFLIVVPLSTLSNWVNEFNKWAPDCIKVVYKGTPDERKRLFKEEVEAGQLNVLLTTYEYIMKDKSYLRKLVWQYIIVDEGHRMKNAQSKFAQILGTVYQSKHRILLTGTPLQNDLPELWALLNFLLPTIFSSVDTFDQWFNKPFAAFRNQAKVEGAVAAAGGDEEAAEAALSQEERLLIVHRLHEVLRPFVLRRVKSQVLGQLPEKVEKVLRCNLSGWQRKMYQSIVHKGLNKAKDGPSGGLSNTIMQLRKVCNHPYLFMRDYNVDEDLIRASGKFALLDRMLPKLKAGGHRVLMFSQMVESMNFIEQFFLHRGYPFCRLDGNTTAEERELRVANFNKEDSPYFIFLLSTRAGGVGINLATADTVIIFDSDWNPMMDAQAQDRAHRIGQKKEVRVFRLLTNSPVEERILARATDKRNLNGLVVEAGQFNAQKKASAQQESKEMMESLLKEWSSGAALADGDEEQVVDTDQGEDDALNEMMASSVQELQLYQNLDTTYIQERTLRWEQLGYTSPLPPRLMESHELPEWLTNDCWPTKYQTIMGDMMNITTQAKGTQMEMSVKLDKKKGRRKERVEEREREEGEISEEEEDGYKVAGKVMRNRQEVAYDDHMTEKQFQRFIEKQQDVAAQQAQAEKAQKVDKLAGTIFRDLVTLVNDLQKIKRDDGSFLAALFVDKPPKALYPDYYQLVTHPIALKQIGIKLRRADYRYFEELEGDLALMSHNARTFNLDTSPIFQDCETIRAEFYSRSLPLLRRYGVSVGVYKGYTPLPVGHHMLYRETHVPSMQLSSVAEDDEDEESMGGGMGGMGMGSAADVQAPAPKAKSKPRVRVRPSKAKQADDGGGGGPAPGKKQKLSSGAAAAGAGAASSSSSSSAQALAQQQLGLGHGQPTSSLSLSIRKRKRPEDGGDAEEAGDGANGAKPLTLSLSFRRR
ncbi:SNF2 family N-terminal domain-containing protein [Ochromonadaceae sp. CCMP2298]|nr:SNF2 family N-terminal domain-containing protein [Ochromonadaceae sp. CCMP2298]